MYKKLKSALTLIFGIVAIGLFQSASAAWDMIDGEFYKELLSEPAYVLPHQDVVITFKSNPMSNPEAVCLAVTFARMLSKNGANVTLFVTLDGVSLADESVVRSRRFKCDTPLSMGGEISLQTNLEHFVAMNDDDTLAENSSNMVVCPLCWGSRYGDELPDYGVLPGITTDNPNAIGVMILNADKILDF